MERLAKNKRLFVGLTCLSIGCLIGSFGYPLQKLHVYKQVEQNALKVTYERNFIITENDVALPYGFNGRKAQLVAKIYQDNKQLKITFLVGAIACSLTAISIGTETVMADEIDLEVEAIKATGRKQLLLESVKHRLAMASKSQRLLFLDEMRTLISEFGSQEGEILEVDELNAVDKFTAAGYLLTDGLSIDEAVTQTWGYPVGTDKHLEMRERFQAWQGDESEGSSGLIAATGHTPSYRAVFPEAMDATCWKAVRKALDAGIDQTTVITEVLGCTATQMELGNDYLTYLKECNGY